QWEILFGTTIFILVAWSALFVLDYYYYTKLLEGAVDAIVEHEGRTPLLGEGADQTRKINLSTIVRKKVPNITTTVFIFYLLVFLALLSGALYIGYRMVKHPVAKEPKENAEKRGFSLILEYKTTGKKGARSTKKWTFSTVSEVTEMGPS